MLRKSHTCPVMPVMRATLRPESPFELEAISPSASRQVWLTNSTNSWHAGIYVLPATDPQIWQIAEKRSHNFPTLSAADFDNMTTYGGASWLAGYAHAAPRPALIGRHRPSMLTAIWCMMFVYVSPKSTKFTGRLGRWNFEIIFIAEAILTCTLCSWELLLAIRLKTEVFLVLPCVMTVSKGCIIVK